jgi:hypothetical protein
VLAPPWEEDRLLPAGGETGIRLVLIGRGVEHAGFARQAVVEAGLRRLGPDRGALDLLAVDPATPPATPHCPEHVEITLSTALRLVEAGRLVGPSALRPRHLLRQGRDDGARRDAGHPGTTDPAAHPRRILLAVTGLSPQDLESRSFGGSLDMCIIRW